MVDWSGFDTVLTDAMDIFDMVGVAVSVVSADDVLYSTSLGVRNLETGEPVTPETHFLVASTTKSMTALLVATFVDEGAFGWDDRVVDLWPDFRAPSDDLTQNLRVRDMLDMASGLGEEDSQVAFHQGDPTVQDLFRLVADLPVRGSPGEEFFYNGTVYSAGGYLPALVQGTELNAVGATYAQQMAERVYGPTGMTTARIADDPRPFSDNYARGYAADLRLGTSVQPYAPVGTYAPAGGTMASHKDMVTYVMMQLNGGVAADGTRVVSSESLAECWATNVEVPFTAGISPDLTQSGYGMGWGDATYRNDYRLISHAGGIDGFTTFIAFLPNHNLGLVINTNMDPQTRGLSFVQYVSTRFLNTQFGLEEGIAELIAAQYQETKGGLAGLAAQALSIDEAMIAPWLGHYEKGWALAFDDEGTLRLHQSSRAMPLQAMPDGSYVLASGVALGFPVQFVRDASGMPTMNIADIEIVRWTTGGG